MESKVVVPNHIAVIMDGNRRYAEAIKISVNEGYRLGYERMKHLIKWCKEFKIKELTLFALSTENLKRDKTEVDFLLNLLVTEGRKFLEEKSLVKVKFIGNRDLLPDNVQEVMAKIEKKTERKKRYRLNLAIAYDGRDEIVRAVDIIYRTNFVRIMKEFGTMKPTHMYTVLKEKDITNNLDLPSEPDLIIRTAEKRLSGFLLWQSSYSEIMFLPDIYWPQIQKKDFKACLDEFGRRRRTYGK